MAAMDNQGISDFQALTNSIATLGAAILPAVLNKNKSKDDEKAKQKAADAAAKAAAAQNNNKNKIFGVGNETWLVVGVVGVVILIAAFFMKKK